MDNTAHPPVSDDLGHQPVSRFMTANVVMAKESFTIIQAMELMVNHKISGLPVVTNDDRLVGVYSEMDAILQAAAKPMTSRIECPNPKLHTCYPDTSFKEALVLMVKNKLKRMPVVNVHKVVVGMITRYDFMKAYLADHRKNNPVKAPLAAAKKGPAAVTKKKP